MFKVSKQAALLRDHFLLKLPFLGDVILTLAVARFLRSLILTQKAGIVITDSLAMGREVVGNKVIERSVMRIETAVANGSTMSQHDGQGYDFSNAGAHHDRGRRAQRYRWTTALAGGGRLLR